MSTKVFYSHGKLLLTGEYTVLDGAFSLALPTNKGQYLSITKNNSNKITWKSFDENQNCWFENSFELDDEMLKQVQHDEISNTLLEILNTAKELNPEFLTENGFSISTRLTFNREFGLGSSSTLIANIAKWAKVNPYELLWKAFGGSGYDIACANANSAITYQVTNNKPQVNSIKFNPVFKEHIYFVYLNQKKSSKEAIKHYRGLSKSKKEDSIQLINQITQQAIKCNDLNSFNSLLEQHESIMSDLLQTPTIKEQLFPDYTSGVIKSLGAWGGDFVLVTIDKESDLDYFKNIRFSIIHSYKDMIL